jgi:tRNA (mo5U34)-methyltransferase
VTSPADLDPAELQAQADSFPWFHSIDLGRGVKTKGLSDPNATVTVAQLPDFAGCSVLDIGAWDGYYSYLAERNGASRVVALDHYAWGVDIPAREAYWNECRKKGTLPDQSRDTTDFWRPELPGRRGFDFAHAALDSKVEAVVTDFTTTDLGALGTFDVVLYLGVLYHMKEPLTCLERLRAVTTGVAAIETAALRLPSLRGQSLLKFHAGSDLNRDFGNWYQPNLEALTALVRAAGFARVEVVQGPPNRPAPRWQEALRTRLTNREQPIEEYRAIVHAFV